MSNLNKSKYTAEDEYPDLENHKNHMAHVLTLEIYKHLRAKQTPTGFTIDHVIQEGVDNAGEDTPVSMGCVAGDEESYEVFAEFFDPVIEARHQGYKPTDKNKHDMDSKKLRGGVFDEKYVLSSRVRTSRSIRGFALPSWNSRAERRALNKIIVSALGDLQNNFAGKFYALSSMSAAEQENLQKESMLFSKPSSSVLARDWPEQRGVWHNNQKNFLVWVNEGDHAKAMSMQKGGNMKETFARFCDGMSVFKSSIEQGGNEFAYNDHHGFVAACPSNIGTGVRASVHMKLPQLGAHARFDEALTKLRLSKNVVCAESGVFDISNSDRIGFSEVQLVQMVIDGVNFLINSEKQLEADENINAEVDKLQQK